MDGRKHGQTNMLTEIVICVSTNSYNENQNVKGFCGF